MPNQHGAEIAMRRYPNLLGALEWVLPHSVTPEQVTLLDDGEKELVAPMSAALSTGRTEVHGYSHANAFKVFPNANYPRIFYPANCRFRRFSKLLRPRSQSAVRTIASRILSSFPQVIEKLAEDVVMITHEESAVSKAVYEYADPFGLAIYVGYRSNRPRPTLWAFDDRGNVKAIAKYASGTTERAALQNEYHILRRLNEMNRFVGRVPTPHKYTPGHLGSVLITDAFSGTPGPLAINTHVQQWLDSCIIGPEQRATDSHLLRELDKQAVNIQGIAQVAFQEAISAIDTATVPVSVVHGDFTPWNILLQDTTVYVFDWESAEPDGVPEWDRVYYILRVGLIARGWRRKRLLGQILELDREESRFYDSVGWRALITLCLVNILLLETHSSQVTATATKLEWVLSRIVDLWWRSDHRQASNTSVFH